MVEKKLRSLDLNLLIALDALLKEKHISRAGQRLGLSQPAMSRSLNKLRILLKDPLLVKGAQGLELTTRAMKLTKPLLTIFTEINHIINPLTSIPAQMQSEITIATRDGEMIAGLPTIIQSVTQEAPGLKIRIISLNKNDLNLLHQNEIDFIITCVESQSTNLSRYLLHNEEFVCLVAKNNPCIKNFDLNTYLQMKHCKVSVSTSDSGLVDRILQKNNLSRNIVVSIQHFLVASYIVSESDFIVTLPRKVANLIAKYNHHVSILESPVSLPQQPIYLYWHIRNQNNPIHQWLRRMMRDKYQQF